MGVLDNFCRFCISELDCSPRRNIFESKNSQLLKTALKCFPLPISADDRYPNFACYPCASKLNDLAVFLSNGLSAVSFFDEYLARNEINCTVPVENRLEANIKPEPFEEIEMDFEQETSIKLETSPENEGEEEVKFGQDVKEIFSSRDRQHNLKKQVGKFSQCDNLAPSIETMPSTQRENASLDANEAVYSETQYNAEMANLQETFWATREQLYFCDHCHKSFPSKSKCDRHILTHTQKKAFQCEHCRKCFSFKANLIIHIRTHTGEKPFKCKLCDKRFNRNASLATHIRVHAGDKPYKCEHCENSFIDQSNCRRHQKVHTRPFKCEDCGKGFSRRSSYDNHIRVYAGRKHAFMKYSKKPSAGHQLLA